MDTKTALVLTGGGARAAYQVGVLRAVADITKAKTSPFKIVSGISAGAINSIWLAAGADDFQKTTELMWKNWANIKISNVFKVNPQTLLWTGAKIIKDLGFGGWFGTSDVISLLDSSPLADFLVKNVDFKMIQNNIDSGLLHSVGISATNYHCRQSVTYFYSNGRIREWSSHGRNGIETAINVDHVMASSAIPIFFPPVRINGSFFGDGIVHLKTPLAPSIKLGAERIFSIGLHTPCGEDRKIEKKEKITFGEIGQTLLNDLFFDTLDDDLENFERINETVKLLTDEQKESLHGHSRFIDFMIIRARKNIGQLAEDEFEKLPMTLRHLLKGLGSSREDSLDMVSYLAFDKTYSTKLLEAGYDDAMSKRDEIFRFFSS